MNRVRAVALLGVLVAHAGCAQSSGSPDVLAPLAVDPRIEEALTRISEPRLGALLERLTSFGTRHTLSNTTLPAHGIGAARQWIADELQRSSPRLQVSFETHQVAARGRIVRDVELRNVIALLPGRSPRRIYVTAHYDTQSLGRGGALERSLLIAATPDAPDPQLRADQDFDVAAPGANDNGSGTALVMEVAGILADDG